ncbi:MAG: hypothetical protein ABIJ15_04125 [bacterium]
MKKGTVLIVLIAAGLLQASFLSAAEEKVNKLIEKAVGEYQRGNSPVALQMVYEILGKYPKNQRAIDLYSQIKEEEAERFFKAAAIYFSNGEIDIARSKIEEGRVLSMDVFLKFVNSRILEAKSMLAEQKVIMCGKRISEVLFFDPANEEATRIQAFLKSNFFSEIRRSIFKEKKILAAEKLFEAKNIKDNPIKSLAIVNEVLALDPSNAEAAKYRKYILEEASKMDETLLQKSEEQLAADKEKAAKYFAKAEECYNAALLEKCFKYLTKAIKRDPHMEKAKKLYRDVCGILSDAEISSAEEAFNLSKIRRTKKHIGKARIYDPQKVIKKADELSLKAKELLKAGQEERGRALIRLAKLFNPRYTMTAGKGKSSEESLKKVWDVYYKGDFKGAGERILDVEKEYPNDLDVLFLKNLISAQISLDEGEFLPTRKYLLAAIHIKPLHQEVWSFFNRLDELLNILGYKFEKQGAK